MKPKKHSKTEVKNTKKNMSLSKYIPKCIKQICIMVYM